MGWNYRIVIKEMEGSKSEYGIHEVFYDDYGKVISMTEASIVPVCDTLEDLTYEFGLMFEAFQKDTLKFGEQKSI